jgi:arylsulfatase A-like enzyme
MLEHLDRGVGQVVQTLKHEQVWENTLLFFFTDNGGARAMEACNAPLRDFKGSNYEGGLRTPFVVSWPARFPGGRKIGTPIISLDVLPTVLEALRVPAPEAPAFDGRSLLPLLRGETAPHHPHLFWSTGGEKGQWAVRSGDWKLVAVRNQRELFNLAEDPAEANNLAQQQPHRVEAMTLLYDAWLDEMADPIKQGMSKRWSSEPAAGDSTRKRPRQRQRTH